MRGPHSIAGVFGRQAVLQPAGESRKPDEDDGVVVRVLHNQGQALNSRQNEEGTSIHSAQVEGLVVDDHTSGTGTDDKTNVRNKILHKIPPMALCNEIGRTGDHACIL